MPLIQTTTLELMRRSISFLLMGILLIIAEQGKAQLKQINGKIRDSHSEEVIPFASVAFYKSTIGKLSDSSGSFTFNLRSWPSDTLIISYAGFEDQYILIDTTLDKINLLIKMERRKSNNEVVVKSKFSKGYLLWRKVVRNKERNDRSRFDNYSYELYNKLEIDLNNVKVEKMQKGFLPPKPFKFILNNVDTTSESTPILPIYLVENISDYYSQKDPNKSREIIRASKTIGLKNESVSKFLGGMYQNVNVYKNFIPVFDRQYVSPISNDGDLYYNYKLADTQYVAGKKFLRLVFFPKRKGENTFQGDVWIADSSFAVQKMNLQVSPGTNINFIEKLSIVQEYQLIQDSIWFLAKDKFIANFNLTGAKNLSLIGRKTTTYNKILINQATPPNSILSEVKDDKRKELVIVANDALEKPDSFWQVNRHEALNKNERNFYKMADSLLSMPEFESYSEWLSFIGTGYRFVGNYEIGPWMNWISGNSYEGLRLRFDLGTNYHFNRNIYFSSYLAYGTKDMRLKGKFETLFMLGKDPRSSIRLLYKNDLDYGQTYYDEVGYDNVFALAARKEQVPIKLINIEEQKIEYFKEWRTGLSLTSSLHRKIYNPIKDLPGKRDFSATDFPGNFNDFQFNVRLRFAYLERFLQDDFFRTSLGSDYPVIELNYSKGIKGILNSGYSYTKATFSISDYLKIPPIGNIYYGAYAGKVWGTLPYMLLNIAPGNEIYYYNKYAFNLMNRYEYIFDEYGGFNIEHNIGRGIFRLLPQNKKLKLRQFWNAKILWGSMSDKNAALNLKTDFPFTSLNGRTYMELGTGVDNILRFFRVDLVWRIAPRPLPIESYKRFGIFGSFRFSF